MSLSRYLSSIEHALVHNYYIPNIPHTESQFIYASVKTTPLNPILRPYTQRHVHTAKLRRTFSHILAPRHADVVA